MAKSTASTPTHSTTGLGSQNSTQHSFDFPNIGCALQCTGDLFNYSTCYNNCVTGNGPAVVQTGGSGSVYSTPSTDVSGSKPVVTPGTNKTTTSGTAVEPSGTPQTGGNYSTSSSSGTPTSTPGSTNPLSGTALSSVNWQDVGIRAGLVIGGSILIIVGVIKIFGAEKAVAQMNQPMTNPVLPRRPSAPPQPIINRRTLVETKPVGSAQSGVDATQSAPIAAPSATAASTPRKYTPRQVGAIRAKQRTHLAHK